MLNARVMAVIKRELRAKLFSKSFILMTLLIPLFLFGVMGIQTLVMTYESDKGTRLLFVTYADSLTARLAGDFKNLPVVQSGYYQVEFVTKDSAAATALVVEKKEALLAEKLTAVVVVPDSAFSNKQVLFYSSNPNNRTVHRKIAERLNTTLTEIYFKDRHLSAKDLSFAKRSIDFSAMRVSKDRATTEEGAGNTIVAFLFTFLLYFSLIFLGAQIMRAVVEEKSSKIVEVLLSSVNSMELLTGKILGTAITGFMQMAIWLLPLIVLITTSWFTLPEDLVLQISLWQVGYFLFNYLLALTAFLGLFAAVGSIFDNDQDAQAGMWPVTILIMVPFFIAMGLMNNPANDIAKIGSMLPFASYIIMPARVSMTDIPAWQFIVSLVVGILTCGAVFLLAGKIYRIGILVTGKKPTWAEVAKWLKN